MIVFRLRKDVDDSHLYVADEKTDKRNFDQYIIMKPKNKMNVSGNL